MTDYTPKNNFDLSDDDILRDLDLGDDTPKSDLDLSEEDIEDMIGDLDQSDDTPAPIVEPIVEADPVKDLPASIAAPVAAADFDRFDYNGVAPDVAKAARAAATKIRSLIQASIIKAGGELLAIKAKLEHGQFGPWLDAEFSMTERTAQNYMSAFELASKYESVSVLPPATLYRLAAPSTPEDVRVDIVAAIARNEIPSADEVRSLIDKGKAARAAERKAAAEAKRAAKETPEEAARRAKLAQREEKKRQKTEDEKAAREAAAQKAADDAVQLLVNRFTDVELLTFCNARRIADYRFDEALKRVEIAAEAVTEIG